MTKALYGLAALALLPTLASAQIQVKVFSVTSPVAAHPQVIVTVPTGYKIISGGARANYTGAGNILTRSFPQGNSWEADSKDADVSDPSTLTGWAVAIYDPNNHWVVCSASATSNATNWPIARVQLPSNCALTGGGATANWHSAGSYITASYPDTNHSWLASAKDHIHADPSTITVYALGIRRANGNAPPAPMIFASPFSNNPVPHPTASIASGTAGYTIVGGGAVDYWGGAGNMLTATYPGPNLSTWNGAGKDHEVSSTATLTAYAVALQNVTVLP